MDKLFYPDNVAIIGALERPDNLAASPRCPPPYDRGVSPRGELPTLPEDHNRTAPSGITFRGNPDPRFEPVVMFGLGGVYVEVFEKVSFRLAPVTQEMAAQMIAEVHGSRLLHGVHGQAPADVDAVIEALAALSRLLVDWHEMLEIDVNPLPGALRQWMPEWSCSAKELDERGLFRYNRLAISTVGSYQVRTDV